VGVSGGEYGVRGHLSAFNVQDGKLVWKAYSEGPDKDLLFNPEKTINGATQNSVGPNSSLTTSRGDEWKVGGGTTWGWYSYDPKLNLIYYGSGNPGSWNPTQRPGKNRWSMTIFARDPETGDAKWVYQMTPHDGWDYDGVNEMILVTVKDHGEDVPALVHFDRNGYAYVLNRETGKPLAIHKYDPSVNWAKEINPADRGAGRQSREDDGGRQECDEHLSCGTRRQGTSSRSHTTQRPASSMRRSIISA
jgi:lanthanide-dependent methanol dehydrogenase